MNILLNKLVSLLMAGVFFLLCFIPFFNEQYGRETLTDVSYGEAVRQKYDIVFPSKAKETQKDVGLLLYVHGGGWTIGDKQWHSSRIDLYSKFGIVCASTNYRFTDSKTSVNEMLDDITSAISSMVELGKERGFNINRVMLTGYSAGAHLALMYAYTRKDTCPIEVVAVSTRSGLTDLSSESFFTVSDLGTPESLSELFSNVCGHQFTYPQIDTTANDALLKASPISYVTKNCVPTLIAHGQLDTTVNIEQSEKLEKALSENGVEHKFIIFPNSGHALDKDDRISKIEENYFVFYMLKYLVQ